MVRSLDFPRSKVLLRGSADRSITMMTAATPDRSHPAEIDGNSFVINFGQLQEEELAQLHFVDRSGSSPSSGMPSASMPGRTNLCRSTSGKSHPSPPFCLRPLP